MGVHVELGRRRGRRRPVLALGAVLGVLVAAAGCSEAAADDAGPADAGPPDAGPADSGPPDAGPPTCPIEAWPASATEREDGVLAELNLRRAAVTSCGATSVGPSAPVTHDAALRRAARCHAFDMMSRGRPGPTGTDGSSDAERALREGYAGAIVAEAYGTLGDTQTAAAIVDLLMSDPVVCNALFAPTTTDVGIGIARDPDAVGTLTSYLEVLAGR